jgi:hypothetical protein
MKRLLKRPTLRASSVVTGSKSLVKAILEAGEDLNTSYEITEALVRLQKVLDRECYKEQ